MKYYIAFLILCLSALPLSYPAQANEILNYEDYPIIKLRSLDKITARTMNIEAKVGSTVRFGDIFIKVQACRKPPPVEKNEAAGFLQIYSAEQSNANSQNAEWIFSGWMFASSPALSAMDHPIYDVWVLDCLGRDPEPLPPPEEQVKIDAPQSETPQSETPQSANPKTANPLSETPTAKKPQEPSLNEILQPEKAINSDSPEPIVEEQAPLTAPPNDTNSDTNIDGIY